MIQRVRKWFGNYERVDKGKVTKRILKGERQNGLVSLKGDCLKELQRLSNIIWAGVFRIVKVT